MLNGMKEPTSSAENTDYETFAVRPDQDHIDLVDLAGTMYDSMNADQDDSEMNYDFGEDVIWSDKTINVSHLQLRWENMF